MIRLSSLKYWSAGFGALVWVLGCLVSGRSEAWDSGLYWSTFFPLLLLGAAVAGARAKDEAAWRQGLWVGAGHAASVTLTGIFAGKGFGLYPLTLVVFIVLTLPLLGAAAIGGKLQKSLVR